MEMDSGLNRQRTPMTANGNMINFMAMGSIIPPKANTREDFRITKNKVGEERSLRMEIIILVSS